MPQRLLLLLFFLLVNAWGAGAQVYEPGLLVRASGDTLRGEIENGFWDQPPTFIRFRAAGGGPSTLFQPRQLRAVSFTKGRYFRYEALPIDHIATTDLMRLPHGNIFDVKVDSVLAEVLLEGPTMLWRVARLGSLHLLVRRPGQPVLDMGERQYLHQNKMGSWVVVEGNNYRNQLGQYFGDCPTANAAAETAAFTPGGVADVVQAYYAACAPGPPTYSWVRQASPSPRHKQVFQGGVLAGVRYSHLQSPDYELAGQCPGCGTNAFGGFYAELLQPSRLSALYGELTLGNFHNQGAHYVGIAPGGTDIYSYYSYRALLATARLGVRFFAPLQHDQQLMFGFGLEHNEVIDPTVTPTSGPAVLPSSEALPYASPTLIPNVGLGWRRQRLTLSLDGQLYATAQENRRFFNVFFDSGIAARLGVSYRLGRSPDAANSPRPATQP